MMALTSPVVCELDKGSEAFAPLRGSPEIQYSQMTGTEEPTETSCGDGAVMLVMTLM